MAEVSRMAETERRKARADSGVKVVVNDTLQLGDVSVSFQRTVRIPEGSNTYPFTPDLGSFPIRSVSDYGDRVPASWRKHGGVFVPLLQREAVWLKFSGQEGRPNAIKVRAGKLCARHRQTLVRGPKDYLVAPSNQNQPWLNGITSGKDTIASQFIATPLGSTVSEEKNEKHGSLLQLLVFHPCRYEAAPDGGCRPPASPGEELWEQSHFASVLVHLCNSELWKQITGQAMPDSPVSEETYSSLGFPWSELYEEPRKQPELKQVPGLPKGTSWRGTGRFGGPWRTCPRPGGASHPDERCHSASPEHILSEDGRKGVREDSAAGICERAASGLPQGQRLHRRLFLVHTAPHGRGRALPVG